VESGTFSSSRESGSDDAGGEPVFGRFEYQRHFCAIGEREKATVSNSCNPFFLCWANRGDLKLRGEFLIVMTAGSRLFCQFFFGMGARAGHNTGDVFFPGGQRGMFATHSCLSFLLVSWDLVGFGQPKRDELTGPMPKTLLFASSYQSGPHGVSGFLPMRDCQSARIANCVENGGFWV